MQSRSWRPWWDWLAVSIVAAIVLGPGLRPGYLLRVDLVMVPAPVATDDTWGLGDRLPRAVPWDGAIWAVSHVLPDRYLGQLALLVALSLAGVGAARLTRLGSPALTDSPSGVVTGWLAGLVAVWNPFVLEQLALGHVPHLLAYAAVPWVVLGVIAADDRAAPRAMAVVAAALGSLTPGGGLLMVGTAAAAALARPRTRAGGWFVLPLVALLQLPWVLAALLHPAVGSTASGTSVFAVRPETPLGVVIDVLGLGGVWAQDLLPGSRGTWLAMASTVLLLSLSVMGLPSLRRRAPAVMVTLLPLAVVGYLVALVPVLPGAAALWDVITAVPGGGLLRDGHRWLAWPTLLVAVAAGHGAAALARTTSVRLVWSGPAVLILIGSGVIAVLPDLAFGVDGRLRAREYPKDWAAVAKVLTETTSDEDRLLSLPWQPFRRFTWSGPAALLDPAPRAFARAAVVSDTLTVSGQSLPGEGPAAARISTSLAVADPALDPGLLAREGVGWILVEHGTPGAVPRLPSEAVPIVAGTDLSLYRLSEADGPSDTWRRPRWQRQLVVGAHLGAAVIALMAAATWITRICRRGSWARPQRPAMLR